MKILFLGDVFGDRGCEYLKKTLPALKKEFSPELVIVNGENSAEGNGILPSSADAIFNAGADVITGGNHSLQRKEIYSYLDDHETLLRPANYSGEVPGNGLCIYDTGRFSVAVISLMGIYDMDHLQNPFELADKLIAEAKKKTSLIVIDYHAESSSEKRAFAQYVAGKVSAVIGTHTHVQTADEQILEGFTGFITDAGMTGVTASAIGLNLDDIITRFKTQMPLRARSAEGECHTNGVLLTVDENGKCTDIVRIAR